MHLLSRLEYEQKFCTIYVYYFLPVPLTEILMQFSNDKEVSQAYVDEKDGRRSIPPPETLVKLPPDGGPEYNRLIFEKSPYLLQHAENPTDWYPWGEEAFLESRNQDKLIFLSIGYSTCHWCHVMAHESFEDQQVAALMNEAFVCIKVDREERPDIDQIYMLVCQAMTGSGGWPLTILMTPDKRPIFSGTYFPKQSHQQRIGMMELVPRISELWKNHREKLLESADQVINFLKQTCATEAGDKLKPSILDTAYHQLSSRFDDIHGGFDSAPKFPSPHNLTFLLSYWHRTGDKRALEMVEKTLHEMRLGGIFDHVGFGFHRYSTDSSWLLPHFEKMLYDQAMLTMAYVETFQATGKEVYARTAREILTYVLRDMTSLEGGFYSAEDADSEGEEGLFYLWTPVELHDLLGKKDGDLFIKLLNVEAVGNFVEEARGETTGRNILHLKTSLAESAEKRNLSEDELNTRWEKSRQKLFKVRQQRIHPFKYYKILTDWNGLMIAALAKGAAALGEPEYAKAARKAVDFIWKKLRDKEGRLLKRYRQGKGGLPAHIEDYAFMVWGLLELYEAVFEVEYLQKAIDLNDRMLTYFWDDENGGLFFTADDPSDLLVRNKEIYDGAVPSGNSVAAFNLLRIGRITGNPDFEEKAIAIGRAFSQAVRQVPAGHTQLMSALNFAFGPSYEVVIAGKSNADDTQAMLKALQRNYFPNKVTLFRPIETAAPSIVELSKCTKFQSGIDGKATAYVCENYACKAPTTDIGEMFELLKTSGGKGAP